MKGRIKKALDAGIVADVWLPLANVETAVERRFNAMLQDGRPVTLASISHATHRAQHTMLALATDPDLQEALQGQRLFLHAGDSRLCGLDTQPQFNLAQSEDLAKFRKRIGAIDDTPEAHHAVMRRSFEAGAKFLREAQACRVGLLWTEDHPGISAVTQMELLKFQGSVAGDDNFKGKFPPGFTFNVPVYAAGKKNEPVIVSPPMWQPSRQPASTNNHPTVDTNGKSH